MQTLQAENLVKALTGMNMVSDGNIAVRVTPVTRLVDTNKDMILAALKNQREITITLKPLSSDKNDKNPDIRINVDGSNIEKVTKALEEAAQIGWDLRECESGHLGYEKRQEVSNAVIGATSKKIQGISR